ncbi:MAG TPA: ABC transporter permease [Rhodanobacteraceae bacterium]|nr:ABC transporter permease [Rhodanobacteraceae bacterium]
MGLHRDLVFALRMLRKNSLLLVVASLSLGLGIGLNTTVFSAVHAALFRAPNIERADDLVSFYSVKEGVRDTNPSSYADFLDMRANLQSVDALVAHSLAMVSYDRSGTPTVQFGALVTSGYFELLGTQPELGRLLRDSDFDPLSLSIGVAVLLVAGVLASIVPARRATSIDPMQVLRQE